MKRHSFITLIINNPSLPKEGKTVFTAYIYKDVVYLELQ